MNLLKKIKTKLLVTTGLVILSSYGLKINAQSLVDREGMLLMAQKLGEIERKIELSEVPATVLSSATTASGAKPTSAQVQINPDGSLVYELLGQNQQGFNFEIEIKPSGEIIEVDEQVEASAVPEEVMKAFKFWIPNAQVVSIWRSTRYESFDYYYEIVMDNDFWVEIPADGKTLKINPLN